jgi:zinc transport system ATP-binding protein
MSQPPLVTMRDVCVSLGGAPILRGVNAELQRGKVTALIGLNGAGKTTLLRALIKESPFTGEIRFGCGHDHSKPTPQHIGYVPQKLRLDANLPLTVLDLFGLSLRRRPLFLGAGRRFRERTEAMLARVGAARLVDALFEPLSGGEKQRVLLALALEPQPELLLLDEPAAGIDFKMLQRFHDLISQLNKDTGVTVLLVSHDLSMVGQVAHHVLCMKDGRIECQGEPRAVLEGGALARTFGADAGLYVHAHHDHDHGPDRPSQGL